MIILPTYQTVSARYSYSIALNGVMFNFNFYWNTRAAQWFFDLADSSNNPLINCVGIVSSYDLLAQYKAVTGMPNGTLYIYDIENDPQTANVDFDSFGSRYLLLFATPEDLA